MGPSAAIVLLVPSSLSRLAETPFLFFFSFCRNQTTENGPAASRARWRRKGSSCREGLLITSWINTVVSRHAAGLAAEVAVSAQRLRQVRERPPFSS